MVLEGAVAFAPAAGARYIPPLRIVAFELRPIAHAQTAGNKRLRPNSLTIPNCPNGRDQSFEGWRPWAPHGAVLFEGTGVEVMY